MMPPASLQELPPQRQSYPETSNLCLSNHAKKPFVVELCTSPPSPPPTHFNCRPQQNYWQQKAAIPLRVTERKRSEENKHGGVINTVAGGCCTAEKRK